MADTRPTAALFADLYELTMGQAYWQHGQTASATFELFFRNYPLGRSYAVFAGLEEVLDHLEALRFTDIDIKYLQSLGLFDEGFLDWLSSFKFTGDVRAMTEGDLVFAGEPVLAISGPLIEAQLVETAVMNAVGLQSMLATKASRVLYAAKGRPIVEFAARRTHGAEAADRLARASYLVGFAGTSNVRAAARYGIPPVGTMAHSFIMSFRSEAASFQAYSESFPDSTTLLVDTYDSIAGTKQAIEVGRRLKASGHSLQAIRLDSGDLLSLSLACRKLLDRAGLVDVKIFASGGLDELEIDELVKKCAPIDGFGVGTKLGVSADAPWMDWAYKLVEYDDRPVLKLSSGKATLPGRKQVYRQMAGNDSFQRDVIGLEQEPSLAEGQPMLGTVMTEGHRIGQSEPLEVLRERFAIEFSKFPEPCKDLLSPQPYPVLHSRALDELNSKTTQALSL